MNSNIRNPFAEPHTLPQWLLASFCWVGSCLGGFLGCTQAASALFPNEDFILLPVVGSAVGICVLMWRRVISVGWRIVAEAGADTLALRLVSSLAFLWLLLLIVAFVVSVVLLVFGSLVVLATAFPGPSQGGGWQ